MGVNNDIGAQSIFGERHILFGNNHSDGSLLTRARGHFVANGGYAFFANLDFCNAGSFFAIRDKCLVNNSELSLLGGLRMVHQFIAAWNVGCHSNNNGFIIDFGALFDQSIFVKFAVIVSQLFTNNYIVVVLNVGEFFLYYIFSGFNLLFMCFINTEVSGSE